jgi:hypothetical protein
MAHVVGLSLCGITIMIPCFDAVIFEDDSDTLVRLSLNAQWLCCSHLCITIATDIVYLFILLYFIFNISLQRFCCL